MNVIDFLKTPVGKNLRRMREKAGLSQSDVARKAGMRPEVVCRLEQGKGNPTFMTIQKIVNAIEKE